jgi:hypothetical protein
MSRAQALDLTAAALSGSAMAFSASIYLAFVVKHAAIGYAFIYGTPLFWLSAVAATMVRFRIAHSWGWIGIACWTSLLYRHPLRLLAVDHQLHAMLRR